jgi:hypothetical protein
VDHAESSTRGPEQYFFYDHDICGEEDFDESLENNIIRWLGADIVRPIPNDPAGPELHELVEGSSTPSEPAENYPQNPLYDCDSDEDPINKVRYSPRHPYIPPVVQVTIENTPAVVAGETITSQSEKKKRNRPGSQVRKRKRLAKEKAAASTLIAQPESVKKASTTTTAVEEVQDAIAGKFGPEAKHFVSLLLRDRIGTSWKLKEGKK